MLPAGTKQALDTYLDVALKKLGRPYRLILSDADRAKDDANQLENPRRDPLLHANLSLEEYGTALADWCDNYDDCQTPGSAWDVLSVQGLYREFAHYRDAPLLFDTETDDLNGETGVVVFRVPPPLNAGRIPIAIPGLTPEKEARRVRVLRSKLAPLDGTLVRSGPIVEALTAAYDGYGLDPEISVSMDGPEPSVSILEGSRIGSLSFPYGLPKRGGGVDWRKTEIVLYSVLPDREFRRGYLAHREAIRNAIADVPAPVLDLRAQFEIVPRELPYVSRLRIPVQQLLLQQNGFSLAIADPKREFLELGDPRGATAFNFVTLRLEDASQDLAPAPAPKVIDAMGKPDAHVAEAQPQPSLVKPTPVADAPASTPAEANAPKNHFLGVGGQYLPGQGIRAFGVAEQTALPLPGMDAALSVRAGLGGGAEALATASFAADYIAFDQLHHRLAFAFQGGQDAQADRFLLGRKWNESRRGGMARLELEWFRDRAGHLLKLFAEGHHDTVLLSKDGTDALRRNLTTIDLGATHLYQSSENPYPWFLRFEPVVRFGPGNDNQQRFARGGLHARFEHALPGRFALRFAGRLEQASAHTPEFELPSLGGQESVRGFRRDDALGQRLWTLQNELLTPVPWLARQPFIRDNVRLAGFFDAGNAYRRGEKNPGIRKGAGLGARLTYGMVVLEADVAYGFGEAATHSRRLKVYFGATVNLPI